MEKLKKALEELEGKCVDIHVQHTFFGEQNVKIKKFIPVTDVGIGFKCRNQEVYIPHDQVKDYKIEKYMITINGFNRAISIWKNT